MKILAVTHIFPFRANPQEGVFNAAQIAEVAKLAQITLLTPVRWTLMFRKGGPSASPSTAAVFEHRSPLYLYPPGILRGYHGHFYLASIRRAAANARKRTQFDLVYGMFAFPDGWAAARLAKKWGLPFVLKVHGSDVHQLRSDPARVARLIEVIRSARRVIAVSEALGREVREIVPEVSVTVVRNGVDLDTFSPGSAQDARKRLDLDPKRPVVLFAGRLEKVKGADFLPQIATGLKTKVRWVVIGRGALSASLRREMTGQDVRWVAEVPHADLVPWYRAADVVVIPSRNEGLPNVLLEALACGRPVVAARTGGVSEVLTDPGVGSLVEPEDIASFSREIDHWAVRPHEEEKCRALVSGRSWGQSGKDVLDVLEEAAAGRC
ncbi:MAG: glycosyltransferase [Pseudomonadota bacterium]